MFQWSWDSIAAVIYWLLCINAIFIDHHPGMHAIPRTCRLWVCPEYKIPPSLFGVNVFLTLLQHLLLKNIYKAIPGLPITRWASNEHANKWFVDTPHSQYLTTSYPSGGTEINSRA
jgi:hypothetical protein